MPMDDTWSLVGFLVEFCLFSFLFFSLCLCFGFIGCGDRTGLNSLLGRSYIAFARCQHQASIEREVKYFSPRQVVSGAVSCADFLTSMISNDI